MCKIGVIQTTMWSALINIILGIIITITPEVFVFERQAATNNYICGPMIITFAITSLWEVNRSARWLNLPIGVWLSASPLLFYFSSSEAIWVNLLSGICISLLSLIKGKKKRKFGGGWKVLVTEKRNEQ